MITLFNPIRLALTGFKLAVLLYLVLLSPLDSNISDLKKTHVQEKTLHLVFFKNLITEDLIAQENHDVNEFLKLRPDCCSPEEKSIYLNILAKNKHCNILSNVISAKLVNFKFIPSNVLTSIVNLAYYSSSFDSLMGFYVGIEYKLKHETPYIYNGINFRIYVFGKKEERWYIIETSTAPIRHLKDAGYGFGTQEENIAEKLQKIKTVTGEDYNPKGKIIKPCPKN